MGRRAKALWPWIERNGALVALGVTVLGASFTGFAAWKAMGAKVERLELLIQGIAQDSADRRCQAVLTRQIAAIEEGRQELRDTFRDLVEMHCRPLGQQVITATASRPATNDELRERLQREASANEEFYKQVSEFDEQLGLGGNRDIQGDLKGVQGSDP